MAAGDTKQDYASSSNLTITLASLASDTNLVAGRESTVIDNTSNKYPDYALSGFITTGTSPTVGRIIEVWLYAILDDTPTYPNVLTGSDSGRTFTNTSCKESGMVCAATMTVTATSDIKYPFAPRSVRTLFGGYMPKKFGVFVVHNTGVNLNSTSGNHQITITPTFPNTAAS